jgi:MFS family permease
VRVTDRVGKGVRSTPRDVLIANAVAAEDTGRAFGFHSAMDHTGAVLGPLVATLLLGLGWPMRQVFLAALVPGVVSVLAVLVVREPATDDAKPAADSGSTATGAAGKLPPRLRGYLGILTLFALGNSSDAFLLLRASAVGVSVAALPALWSLFHVAKVLSSYLGGGLSDRVSRPKLILLGWVVYALSYLGFGLAQHAWQCWALFVVYGTYYGLTEPVEKALVRDLAPRELRGRAYGYYNFTVGFSAIPAGLLTGYVWQTWSPLAAMCTGATLAGTAAIALWWWSGNETLQPGSS